MKTKSIRIDGLTQSDIRRMTIECQRVGGINLGQGICDLPTPPPVLDATASAVTADRSVYSRYTGIAELRRAIADKMKRDNGRPTDPDEEVVVTVGATGAFAATCQALLNPGDRVILFEPYYGYHRNTLKISGCPVDTVALAPPEFAITREMLEQVIRPETAAIVVNTPANPSGKVFDHDELTLIAEVCQEHDLLAITDEIYEYIVYDGRQHVSLATLEGMADRTVTISGFSKTFSITGWRLGYVVACPALSASIGLVNDLFYVCAPTPLQHGVAAGMLALGDDYYQGLASSYAEKRQLFCRKLDDVGLPAIWPAGAYYVLADVSRLDKRTAREAAMHLLETIGVASVPGSAFYLGDEGESLTRFCFAKETAVLEEACERLDRL